MMKTKIYQLVIIAIAVSILSVKFSIFPTESKFSENHLIIVLRNIGHQLLLREKDSTSRILPIKKLSENIFQIEFQHPLAFMPDTLVNLVHSQLKSGNLPTQYIVSILNCSSKEMVYGYEISDKTDNILSCLGRKLPLGCYIIQIEFLADNYPFYAYFLLLVPVFLAGYWLRTFFLKNKNRTQLTDIEEFIKIGRFSFYPQQGFLKYKHELIETSEKENKLLKIFAENQNQLIERERCLKEVWEDEGTIVVGRSLDVLVSKLRKKLLKDEAIKIINIHGKGYKMIIE